MIGSFWNLCRACPSMPVDKLHSEYRSTYRWHEYTGPRQEVVRRPPAAGAPSAEEKPKDISHHSQVREEDLHNDTTKTEPLMHRRKKYPDLAYRHNEFMSNNIHRTCTGNQSRTDGRPYRRGASEPRKSKSMPMGLLKPNAYIHRKRIDDNRDASELEPLVDEKSAREPKAHIKTEYMKKFRPFSQYEYSDGRFVKRGGGSDETDDVAPTVHAHPAGAERGSWYREVIELRKKAGEYKHRGWRSDLSPEKVTDIYNKQVELWDQVSRTSSLSALSLASMSYKNYTKEEKNNVNIKRTSPSKALRNAENSRIVKDIARHHLDRTTGGDDLDCLILSPTREKLEPTLPRKETDMRGTSSPKKSSPLKTKKPSKTPKNFRSQSVGPIETDKKSPKRQSRSATVKERKTPTNSTTTGKQKRPSSLNTTARYRSAPTKTEDNRLANHSKNSVPKLSRDAKPVKPSETTKPAEEHTDVIFEPVIKSPPEPTRVKSPEQILMKSPDPVNWTVPLDTGKTFTVTQNVREGEMGSRPHSEVKAWTPSEVQSAPSSLDNQRKETKTAGDKIKPRKLPNPT